MIDAQAKLFGASPSKNSSKASNAMHKSSKSTVRKFEGNASSIKSEDLSYTIDPITNKRVYETADSAASSLRKFIEIPVNTFQTWLTPLQHLNPFSSDPMRESLKDYEKEANSTYSPVYYNEPDGKAPVIPCSVQQGLKAYDDKVSYGPVYHNEPDGKPMMPLCSMLNGLLEYDSKVNYGPVMYREPDGKLPDDPHPSKTGLEDFDEKSKFGRSSYSVISGSTKPTQTFTEDKTEDLDLLRASDILAASGRPRGARKETDAEKQARRQRLEEDFQRAHAESIEDIKIEHSELLNHIAHARGRIEAKLGELDHASNEAATSRKFTGNYVRDFPEEFETKWSNTNSSAGVLVPDKMNTEAHTEQTQSHGAIDPASSVDKIQPALDRNDTVHKGTKSNVIRGYKSQESLNKQGHKELVQEIRQIYEDAYGTLDSKHRAVDQSAPVSNTVPPISSSDQPIVYKILAYDPTMQSIGEAETTSIVTDSANPLTPAEVLLRLSNPAKFFPHFAPLQAAGYEILTGGGDVLVFRKIRDARSGRPSLNKTLPTMQRNPIDGMQAVAATGNFASPTGFVNYDLPQDTAESNKSEPRFKSNIDMRREEDVFSGKSNWQDGAPKKKSGRGRKILIGAVWVGACSYAVGVVAEFFKTGGAGGFPKGF